MATTIGGLGMGGRGRLPIKRRISQMAGRRRQYVCSDCGWITRPPAGGAQKCDKCKSAKVKQLP